MRCAGEVERRFDMQRQCVILRPGRQPPGVRCKGRLCKKPKMAYIPGAMLNLVACGTMSPHIRECGDMCMYVHTPERSCVRNSWGFTMHKMHPPTPSHPDWRLAIPKMGDIVSDAFLVLECCTCGMTERDITRRIGKVRLVIGDKVISEFTGHALLPIARMVNPRSGCAIQTHGDSTLAILPLPFHFMERMHLGIPLALRDSIEIHVETHDTASWLSNASIQYKQVVVDMYFYNFMKRPEQVLRYIAPFHSEFLFDADVQQPHAKTRHTIANCDGVCQWMIVLVSPPPKDDPVGAIELCLNGVNNPPLTRMPGLFARKVVPDQYFGFSVPDGELCYVIPIDEPAVLVSQRNCTADQFRMTGGSAIHMYKHPNVDVSIEWLIPGRYDVRVVVSELKTLCLKDCVNR